MPIALTLGVEYKDFWSMNPRKIKIFSKAKEMKIKEQMQMNEWQEYMGGIYFARGYALTQSKTAQYPKELLFNVDAAKEKTPEMEQQEYGQQVFAQMMRNMRKITRNIKKQQQQQEIELNNMNEQS